MAQNLDFGMKCIKYMLFVSNFMFVMVGVLLISFGSAIKTLYAEFELFMEDHYFSPAQLTIAIGFIILLVSFFGCVAAIKESACLVNLYALLLTLVLILELAAAISAYAMRSSIEEYLEANMKEAMMEYSKNNETAVAVDQLQLDLHCCGIYKEDDWFKFTNQTSLPKSCCSSDPSAQFCNPDDGCLPRLSIIMDQSAVMLGTSSLCIVIVQILGIAFAVMLSKAIRRLKTALAMQRWQDRTELYLQLARGHDKNPPPTPVPVTYSVGNTPDSSAA